MCCDQHLWKEKVRKHTDQREKLGFRTGGVKAFSQLTGASEAGMVLWTCPKLGEGDWAFMLLCWSVIESGVHVEGGLTLGEAFFFFHSMRDA